MNEPPITAVLIWLDPYRVAGWDDDRPGEPVEFHVCSGARQHRPV
jgi:hypothetical protein